MAKYANNGFINMGQISYQEAMLHWIALNEVHFTDEKANKTQLQMLRILRAKLLAGGVPKEHIDEHDHILLMFWDANKNEFIDMDEPLTRKDWYAVKCKRRDKYLGKINADDN